MILPDANLLLYAYNKDAAEHAAARRWLEDALSSPAPFALSWQTITAFLRISTNSRAFPQPLSIDEAISIVDEWLARPNVTIVAPGARHWEIFARLLRTGKAAGALTMDAHLAALAVEHGATLCTTDRDFARFEELKFVNPLAAKNRGRK